MPIATTSCSKEYVLPQLNTKSCQYTLKFISLFDDTLIRIFSGAFIYELLPITGQQETFNLISDSLVQVKASNNVYMFLHFNYPCLDEDSNLNVHHLQLIPNDLFLNKYIWSTPKVQSWYGQYHFISIVAPDGPFEILLDHVKISLNFKEEKGVAWTTSLYEIMPGQHEACAIHGQLFAIYALGWDDETYFAHDVGYAITDSKEVGGKEDSNAFWTVMFCIVVSTLLLCVIGYKGYDSYRREKKTSSNNISQPSKSHHPLNICDSKQPTESESVLSSTESSGQRTPGSSSSSLKQYATSCPSVCRCWGMSNLHSTAQRPIDLSDNEDGSNDSLDESSLNTRRRHKNKMLLLSKSAFTPAHTQSYIKTYW
ncbi:uncharacterized protein LOC131947449 [Physella acuta]|uniref:uncharacterized protein LOC131947449 n=1 Tax=Physella acuta TaxID=109671 RepID=UPI0027DD5469|nr:uncharacterized protein LOC131947449 [Physella acuta]